MICPVCGSFISPGDAYCPECGATFRLDDDGLNEHVSVLKAKIVRLIREGKYESALEEARQLQEFSDVSDELDSLRCSYVELYDEYARDLKYGDAADVVDEYLEVFPDDMQFLNMISLKARQHRHTDLLDEISYRLDRADGFEADVDF